MGDRMTDARAVIRDGEIVISVSLKALPHVVEGAWAIGSLDTRWKLTDAATFAKELVGALNDEDEQGTTLVHKMFDKAILEALEQGAEGIEKHEKQNA